MNTTIQNELSTSSATLTECNIQTYEYHVEIEAIIHKTFDSSQR